MLGIDVAGVELEYGKFLVRLIAVRRGSVAEDLGLEVLGVGASCLVSRVNAVDAQRHLSGGDTVILEFRDGRGVVNDLGVPELNLVSGRT